MKHFKKSALLISLSLALAACGGGGSDSGTTNTGSNPPNTSTPETPNTGNPPGNGTTPGTTTPTPPDEPTGSLVEKLDTSKEYRVQYDYSAVSGSSKVVNVNQNDQGIVTEFGPLKLSGSLVGKEISGNKNFALGRVAKGTVDYENYAGAIETTEISKYSNGSLYFFAYQPLVNKVASAKTKQINCTNLESTQARVTNGRGNAKFIAPTVHNGSITLNPDGSIGVAFTLKSDSDETSYASSMTWIENSQAYNGFNLLGLANQPTASNQIGVFSIGQNGPNSLVVGSIYNITLNNGGAYQGLASMTCSI